MHSEVSLGEFLEEAHRQRARRHGVCSALVHAGPSMPEAHVPGAAGLPLATDGSIHASLLGPRDREIRIASIEAGLAAEVAKKLRDAGRRVRAVTTAIGRDHLVEGPPVAALWSPDPYLAQRAPHWAPSEVLDLGCGSGRDSVYLAQLGHRVRGVDRLGDALDLARRRAWLHGVSVEWIEHRLADGQPAPTIERGVLIAVAFQHPERLWAVAEGMLSGGRLLVRAIESPRSGHASRAFALDEVRQRLGRGWTSIDGPRKREERGQTWIEFEAIRD